MKINYSALRVGDMVVCGGRDGLAALVRFATMRKRIPYNRNEVSTHTGIVVDWAGQKFIAEMGASGLAINPFKRYLNGGPRYILDIKRHIALSDLINRDNLNNKIASDYRHTIEYDYKGAISFVIDRVKQDKNRYYCSEYFVWRTSDCGVVYPSELLHMVSPQQLNELTDWKSVPNWKGEAK